MGSIILKDYTPIAITDIVDIGNLQRIANIPIEKLCNSRQLLVFPDRLGLHYDSLENQEIISMQQYEEHAIIEAKDLLGFVGVKGTQLSIGTRFTGIGSKDYALDLKDDYLLHYMLQKVLKINIFKLYHPDGEDPVLDVLAYMFPGMLSNALRQGLLKRYTYYERNDVNVRGTIDISRHIRHNIPFNGRIAYNQRELTTDNPAIQLIRHTIEYLRTSEARSILTQDAEVKNNVSVIVSATPNYKRQKRLNIIKSNRKRNPHPYYTAYDPLIQLCIAILEHKRISYSQDGKDIYGILFSGSWLWEEYLNNSIFNPIGFLHPDNRRKFHAIHIFNGKINMHLTDQEYVEKNYAPRYPDYIYEDSINESKIISFVADAKYRLHTLTGDRDNLHQLITYMYITKAINGALIYPISTAIDQNKKDKLKMELSNPKVLNGHGGYYYRIGFEIPTLATDYSDFSIRMQQEESRIKNAIKSIFKRE